MGTDNVTVLALALACSLLGCGTGAPAGEAAEDESLSPVAVRLGRGVDGNAYALASDGYVEFYSGEGIADLVESGEIAHDSTHPYLMLRVPSELVDTAARRAERVVSASMEDASNDLAVTIRPAAPISGWRGRCFDELGGGQCGRPRRLRFRPGRDCRGRSADGAHRPDGRASFSQRRGGP